MGKSKNRVKVESGLTSRSLADNAAKTLREEADRVTVELRSAFMNLMARHGIENKKIPKNLEPMRVLEEWFRQDAAFHSTYREFRGETRTLSLSKTDAIHRTLSRLQHLSHFNDQVPQCIGSYDIYKDVGHGRLLWPLRWSPTFSGNFRTFNGVL